MELVRLRSGREVRIREIRAEDGERLNAAYDRLSPESQYRRFFTPKPHLTPRETRYLVEVDGASHFALVATQVAAPEEIIAVARFVRLIEEPDAAEPAIVVGDSFQGEGLASALLERLADAALERGIVRFRAAMLADNVPARRLVQGLTNGHARERGVGLSHEVEIELDAPRAPGPAIIDRFRGSSRSEPAHRSSALASKHSTTPSRRSRPAAARSRRAHPHGA